MSFSTEKCYRWKSNKFPFGKYIEPLPGKENIPGDTFTGLRDVTYYRFEKITIHEKMIDNVEVDDNCSAGGGAQGNPENKNAASENRAEIADVKSFFQN